MLQPGAQARADEPVIDAAQEVARSAARVSAGSGSITWEVEGEVVVSAIDQYARVELDGAVHRALRLADVRLRDQPRRCKQVAVPPRSGCDGEPVAVYYRLTVGFTRRSSF